MAEKNFKITILETKGACDSEIFKIMVENGDVTADKVSEMVDSIVRITGLAKCNIKTDDKDFNINYYATQNGFLSSGSEVFLKSVETYLGKIEYFKIAKIKTKKGSTYKAVPVLQPNVTDINDDVVEDLPY